MRLLVDTHALLWAIDSPEKLGPEAREVLTAAGQRIFVSTVSLWEIAIKLSLGRLDLDADWRNIIESGLRHMHGRWLTIKYPCQADAVFLCRDLPRGVSRDGSVAVSASPRLDHP